jgi:hypothetical protein
MKFHRRNFFDNKDSMQTYAVVFASTRALSQLAKVYPDDLHDWRSGLPACWANAVPYHEPSEAQPSFVLRELRPTIKRFGA